jgi:alanine-glyoxylate transaminase/serine-glyoxylate transaminase/serine-pyruvate transaminase
MGHSEMTVSALDLTVSSLTPRLLLGPGPSPVSPRVLRALAHPPLGHLDPQFLAVLDDVNERLRGVFGTTNDMTYAVSGTGSAGMQAALVNALEPGDTAIIGVNGYFGTRLVDMARRLGANVVQIEAEWGRVIDPERVIEAHRKHPGARVVALVLAETSTGAWQPLHEIGAHLRDSETLFVVDAVTALGGIPVEVDNVGADICYSATQKCVGTPPGLSPITYSPKAMRTIGARTTPVTSWYFDVTVIGTYLGPERRYHHTVPINLFFALHEALREIHEEGLASRFERHARVGALLREELGARGFTPFTEAGRALPQLTALRLPGAGDEASLRSVLLNEHGIEVGGGLGPAKGKIWRIGLMGHGAREESVERMVEAVDRMGMGRA